MNEPFREVVEYCLTIKELSDMLRVSGVQRRRLLWDTAETINHDSPCGYMSTIPADSVPATEGLDCRTNGDGV